MPKQLSETFSLKTMDGVNGYSLEQITGWEYGLRQFGPGRQPCNGYQWLDSSHLLLYPRTGEGMVQYGDGSSKTDLTSQIVVMNLENGVSWLPRNKVSPSAQDCGSVLWSQELGILINQETLSSMYASQDGVITYTFDGKRVSEYWGTILGVSPSGKKILVDEDTIIDLRTGQIADLAWHKDYDFGSSQKLYWSSDETRLYRCCFYFADLKTGKSYNLEWNDLQGADGKPISFTLMSPHVGGQWVRNDTYFFPTWSYMSDAGDPRIIFSPIEKKYYFIDLPSTLPINPETMTYTFSRNGMHVWITGFNIGDGVAHDFLVNLTTLEIISYDTPGNDFFWSDDSKFGWMNVYDSGDKYILSAAKKTLIPFPVPARGMSWRPNDHLLAFFTNEGLAILDPKDMSLKGWKLPSTFSTILWSPDGNHIALVAKDGSVWQVDYPAFQNLEQLTTPMPDVRNIFWSPDGNSIAFISGVDIYIVKTTK
jgi:dipeptidyl aminopeptidase/acylaminoacyl peptidase